MKKQIPNLFTLGNLLCGTLAILSFTQGDYKSGVLLIGGSAFLDFFDGFAARMLKVSGEFGKQLDSLADLVSFGVAPSIGFMYAVGNFVQGEKSAWDWPIWIYAPLLIALFSAYRLAKFNIDTRQTDKFIGLPTPSNAMLILSVVWAIDTTQDSPFITLLTSPFFVVSLAIVSSLLLISEIRLLALKFRSFGWSGNQSRYILIASAVIIIAVSGISGLSIVVLLYLLISIIDNRIHRHEVPR